LDSGYSWYQIHTQPGFEFTDADFADNDHGYVAGTSGIIKIHIGGQSWVFSAFTFPADHVSLSFPVFDTGFATWGTEYFWMGSCSITKSFDGGTTWIDLLTRKGSIITVSR
jgi:hypothetical protein